MSNRMRVGRSRSTSGAVDARRIVQAIEVRASRAEWAAHRRLLAVGGRVRCPVCGWSGVGFAASRKPRRVNRLCPQCFSSERDRALHMWLADRKAAPGAGPR